ncbi:glycosyltransferase family 9 protein [Hydrocarboniclastica marina]|uniref:glycosyltransferase family 9 protein n=1 Tax=Hydrocarboniclastica marina TaxID=2259620 RepID=UPI0010A8511B|nr:glycosyltransferase family 9 protein [Hydrocarboniclastica marina]
MRFETMAETAILDPAELRQLKKVLVIQLGPFGDGLLTTSYFETLKKVLPQVELHYLIKAPYHHSVKRHPFIDRLIVIPQGSGLQYLRNRIDVIRAIRHENYDLVIDQQNKPSSRYITWLSRARWRLGYTGRHLIPAYNLMTPKGPKIYTASRRFDILKPLGIEKTAYKLYFPIPDEDQARMDRWLSSQGLTADNTVVVSPGSRQSRKKWLTENYAQLADLIQQRLDKRIVILWAGSERPDADRMAALMETTPVIAPQTSLEEAAALLKRCCLLLCNDSGLNHIAVTTQTQTLAIFGNTSPARWSPASEFSHHHHLRAPVPGEVQGNDFQITPELAFSRVSELLGADEKSGFGRPPASQSA